MADTSLRDAVKTMFDKFYKDEEEIYLLRGVVTEVDEDALTCSVKPNDDNPEIYDVLLSTNGDLSRVEFPKVDTQVTIGFLDKETAMVLHCEELDKIQIKAGGKELTLSDNGLILGAEDNGGLIIIAELVSKLNALENQINDLKAAINSAPTTPQDGGAGFKAGLLTWTSNQMTPTQQTELENDFVKH